MKNTTCNILFLMLMTTIANTTALFQTSCRRIAHQIPQRLLARQAASITSFAAKQSRHNRHLSWLHTALLPTAVATLILAQNRKTSHCSSTRYEWYRKIAQRHNEMVKNERRELSSSVSNLQGRLEHAVRVGDFVGVQILVIKHHEELNLHRAHDIATDYRNQEIVLFLKGSIAIKKGL